VHGADGFKFVSPGRIMDRIVEESKVEESIDLFFTEEFGEFGVGSRVGQVQFVMEEVGVVCGGVDKDTVIDGEDAFYFRVIEEPLQESLGEEALQTDKGNDPPWRRSRALLTGFA